MVNFVECLGEVQVDYFDIVAFADVLEEVFLMQELL